jgi:hypothetical protein
MALDSDAMTVAVYAERVLPLAASLGDEYYYQGLPLCVIDAVFSIGVRYSGTRQLVARYCEYTQQRRLRVGKDLPPTAEQEAVTTFCDRPEQADPSRMAERAYGNRQRTSTKNGILKAEAAIRFAGALRSHGVEFLQDVPRIADSACFEADIRSIPGQGSGISLQYFWMLAGADDFIKPDRMVLRFLQSALSRSVPVQEASSLLRSACRQLAAKYPALTPRLIDHEVWKYQRTASAAESSSAPGPAAR